MTRSKNDLEPSPSRADRAANLLDLTIEKLSAKIREGEVSAGTLREVLALARASGVDFGREGQSMCPSGLRLVESVRRPGLLDCLDDVDPAILL